MQPVNTLLLKYTQQNPRTYPQIKDFIEKQCPQWVTQLIPRRINAPSDYWPQKVLAVATIQGLLCNQLLQNAGHNLASGLSQW